MTFCFHLPIGVCVLGVAAIYFVYKKSTHVDRVWGIIVIVLICVALIVEL